jgi:protoporphyrinogen/coproporphyrinogen III oxidase
LNISLSPKKIGILGAGISGLTAAYLLQKKGYEVTVLEKKSSPGGAIETDFEKGYLLERGPNSALETTPVIAQLVDELHLKDEIIYGSKQSNKRYILRDNKLHALPVSPQAFLKTKLFSSKAKGRLFLEPFISRSKDGYYQSISEFVKRRLGEEFLDYAINPFVAGVYAGNPDKLSVKSAFPLLYNLEEKYGGLIIGTVRSIRERKKRPEKAKQSAKMFSFKKGMHTLTNAIAAQLDDKIIYSADVSGVEKKSFGYGIHYSSGNDKSSLSCDAVISTIPAFNAADIFKNFDPQLANHLREIYYPPVLVVSLSYNKSSVKLPLDGFGFLVPEKEKKSFLGAIWNSIIFPERADDDKALFTLFVGGARDPEIINYDKQVLINKVKKEFEEIMHIKEEPLFISSRFWGRAIPQYNLGYIEHENYFDKFERENPGFILSGNYRGGISVSDCIKNSEMVVNKLLKQYEI